MGCNTIYIYKIIIFFIINPYSFSFYSPNIWQLARLFPFHSRPMYQLFIALTIRSVASAWTLEDEELLPVPVIEPDLEKKCMSVHSAPVSTAAINTDLHRPFYFLMHGIPEFLGHSCDRFCNKTSSFCQALWCSRPYITTIMQMSTITFLQGLILFFKLILGVC